MKDKKYGSGLEFYQPNVDPRRIQEHADARLVAEDHNAIANLSAKPINIQVNIWKNVERLNMFDQSDM